MPGWLWWMFGIGGYLAGWIVSAFLTAGIEAEAYCCSLDIEEYIIHALLGMLWPIVIPGALVARIVKAMVEAKEKQKERREKEAEKRAEIEKYLIAQNHEAAYWRRKAEEAEESNRILAEQYNRMVKGGDSTR